jgi:hypothetical protein
LAHLREDMHEVQDVGEDGAVEEDSVECGDGVEVCDRRR